MSGSWVRVCAWCVGLLVCVVPSYVGAMPGVPMVPAGGAAYVGVVPERVLDTRVGVGAGVGVVTAGSTVELSVVGGGSGVDDDAAAVVLNVTAVEPQGAGFVTVFPCGDARPEASNLNVQAGVTVANLVVAKVGSGGRVCLFVDVGMHLLADLGGWYPAGAGVVPVVPERVLDTRAGGVVGAGGTVEVVVAGGGSGVPGSAAAVVLNVTAVEPEAAGYVTVFPCGDARPEVSNVNMLAGATVPNSVVVKVGSGGRVCVFSSVASHLLVDLAGWYPSGAGLTPLSPVRRLDTRSGVGTSAGEVAAGGTVRVGVTGGGSGVPDSAAAVVVNVTAVEPRAAGFVTVFACGDQRPEASNLNMRAGVTVANAAITKVGTQGRICVYSDVATHLLVDVNAWMEGATGNTTEPPPTDSGVDLTPSGEGVTGNPTTSGLPDDYGDVVPGPTMVAAGVDDVGVPDVASMRSLEDAATLPSRYVAGTGDQHAEMYFPNEPVFPIGRAAYATEVSPAIGRLVMWRLVDGQWYRANSCSGTVVARTMVLTAAHCLRDAQGKWWDGYTFVPGLYGSSQPYGEWTTGGDRAWLPTLYNTYGASSSTDARKAAHLFDYAFVKFDASSNGGKSIGDYTGAFQIYQGAAASTPNKFAVGYPVEGYYDSANGGWCDRFSAWCYPYFCSSANGNVFNFGNDWRSVGFGCDGSGGMSGGGIFSQIGGTWYVVSVVSQGGWIRTPDGRDCIGRSAACPTWYMPNMWGPEFVAGYLDALFHEVAAF